MYASDLRQLIRRAQRSALTGHYRQYQFAMYGLVRSPSLEPSDVQPLDAPMTVREKVGNRRQTRVLCRRGLARTSTHPRGGAVICFLSDISASGLTSEASTTHVTVCLQNLTTMSSPGSRSDSSGTSDTSEMSYSYSREETVATIRDFYRFLTSMYLDEAKVLEPPEGGWPNIPVDGWPNFNKTDEVMALLRELPYIDLGSQDTHGAPDVVFADWRRLSPDLDGKDRKEWSEPDPDEAEIPAHIVGITVAQGRSPAILLDTELGVIYWYECHGDIKRGFDLLEAGDAYGWLDDGLIDESQVRWRSVCGIWTIADFFENLKTSFKKLDFCPIGPREVHDERVPCYPKLREMQIQVKQIYREHGWPDMSKFDKKACSAEIKSYLEIHDPGLAES